MDLSRGLGDVYKRQTESFEPELENPIEMQEMGWNMILQNFKKYAESVV
jgi:hypothetical protein